MDILTKIFEEQENLQNVIAERNKDRHFYQKEPFGGYRIFMITTNILHESVELQRETNFKYWKQEKNMDINKIKEETMDIFHFFIQLCLEIGLNPTEIFEKYMSKMQVNLLRQEKNY